MIKPLKIWARIVNGGDGSAGIHWYLTEEECVASEDYDERHKWETSFAEPCNEIVETFEGSVTHQEAIKNSKELSKALEYEKEGKDWNGFDEEEN